jgi:hypothetical protein
MNSRYKKALIAAVIVIAAASILRVCRSDRRSAGTVERDRGSRAVSHRSDDGGGFFGFIEQIFSGSQAPRDNDQPPENIEQGRLTPELNELADKLEAAEKLPDSVWYPNSTEKDEIERHSQVLREIFMLGTMVRTKTASPEQRERYIELKMKLIQEKMEMIRQFQDKARGIGDNEEDGASGAKLLQRLDDEVSKLREALRKR